MSLDVAAVRAECLFLAPVEHHTVLDRAQTDALIAAQIRAHGGVQGCAADFAEEWGHHPVESAARMNWALYVVRELYGTNGHRKAA